ncbi:MAG: prohibitin family protein [Lactobacillales bacterium]|jgi:regulator of protease activity HflC (stomatin/prohibitin superfamily)|nr:prohibitin family protein [Lactobacillales bacterium]
MLRFRNILIILAVVVLIVLPFSMSIFQTIDSGEKGVRTTFGKVSGQALDEGLHLKIPGIQEIHIFTIRTQKVRFQTKGFSKDVQEVEVLGTINYSINPQKVADIYTKYGKNYEKIVIEPVLFGVLKNELGQWEAANLVEGRAKSEQAIEEKLQEELTKNDIIVNRFVLEDLGFSNEFEASIERKVVESQNALAQKHVTTQEEEKARQVVIRAEAETKAIKLRAEAVSKQPSVLMMEAIKKWDGKLPVVVGDGKNLLDLKGMTSAK